MAQKLDYWLQFHVHVTDSQPSSKPSCRSNALCISASHSKMYRYILSYITELKQKKQEDQLMLTNPRDAFTGQSRSPNSSIPYVRYSFLLCNSNFIFRRAVFTTVDFKKCRGLEIWVTGHSRSLKEVPFYTPAMVSY